jgi:H+/Cl- antiporter ClcA/CBS domain-containing protein
MTKTDIIEPQILISPESKPSLSDRLTSLLNQWQPSPELIFLISAFLIGSGSGLAIVFFRYLIDLCETLTFKHLMGAISLWGFWTVAFIPIVGGLIIGLMRWLFPSALGQNPSALISNIGGPRISPFRPLIKMIAAAVSLGTGASLGPEGPSVEIGSNFGVLLGQIFQVSQERYRLLLGAGAAAGLSAGFHTPIAGVFFALEVVLGTTFASPAVSIILLSAVSADIVSRSFPGTNPEFHLPAYQFVSHWEWIFYIGLGLLASILSFTYTQSIKLAQTVFQGQIAGFSWLGRLPQPLKPVLGGAIVGAIALLLPEILGVGYGTLETILKGQEFSLLELFLLLLAKLTATAISLGSGFVGGIFAPALFLGGCLGAFYVNLLDFILPASWSAIAPTPAFAATVGMAAVLAGSVKAPLTAIILLCELMGNYNIILPLMAAVGICTWIVEQIMVSQAVKGLDLKEMGINLERPNDLAILQQTSVASIMEFSYLTLLDSTLLLEAGWKMIQAKCYTALVLDNTEQLVGIITLSDLRRKILELMHQSAGDLEINLEIKEICTREVLYAYKTQSVAEALKQMTARDIYLLPVVAPENPRKVIGIVERNRIKLAKELAETETALMGIPHYFNQREKGSDNASLKSHDFSQ